MDKPKIKQARMNEARTDLLTIEIPIYVFLSVDIPVYTCLGIYLCCPGDQWVGMDVGSMALMCSRGANCDCHVLCN